MPLTRSELIKNNRPLFWYTPDEKLMQISDDLLVETILNYGDIQAFKQLVELMGIDEVANRFFLMVNTSERRKGNFHEMTVHYFTLYFKKHAHRNTWESTEGNSTVS